jgi:outer membrane protein
MIAEARRPASWALALCMGACAAHAAGPTLPDVLDLATAQQIALEGHPSIDVAEARVQQAQARYRIVRASFMPSVGVGGSWTHSDLPDRYFESDLPSLEQSRAAWDEANGSWSSGDLIEEYLRSPLADASEAWVDGNLPQYLLEEGSQPHTPLVSESELRRLQSYLQNRQPLTESEAEDIADALRASYLDATIGETPTFYSVGAHASWMVFDGFSRVYRRAAAIHGEQRTVSARRDAERLLMGSVAAAYCQAQYASEEVAIAQADLDFTDRLLQESVRGREAGLRPEDDVLDFRVRRNASESSLIEARRKHRLSLHALAAVMALPGEGLPATIALSPLGPADGIPAPAEAQAEISYAIAHRPDVAAARSSSAARRADQGTARSTFYPSVWLTGGYDGIRHEDIDFEEDDFGWNAAMLLSFEIFRGGARLAAVSERTAALAAAQAGIFQSEIDAMNEVRDAIASLESAREQYALQSRSLEMVERFRNLVEMQYIAGTAPALKLHDAQRKLVSAQRRNASALTAVHAAWHQLQQATARSLEQLPQSKEPHDEP